MRFRPLSPKFLYVSGKSRPKSHDRVGNMPVKVLNLGGKRYM